MPSPTHPVAAQAQVAALDTFTRAYIECALWSSTDEDGTPLDRNYSASDIAPEAMAKIIADCAAFQADNAAMMEASQLDTARCGHNFWLNRNGHGSGFWDEWFDGSDRQAACDVLSLACKAAGSADLYMGDNGSLYLS